MSAKEGRATWGSAVATDVRARELELVQACVEGDPDAWAAFVARWRPFIVNVARRVLAQEEASLAEDVASDVLAQLLARDRQALRSFAGRSALSTWLAVLTRRAVWKLVRPERRSGRLASPELVVREDPTPSAEARITESRRLVRVGLEQLPPRDRLALELFYEGGHSYKHIARALEIPVRHVSSLMARARAKLLKVLERPSRSAG